MKKRSCGVSREAVLRGLRRVMVVFTGPYSCLFWRICKAYALHILQNRLFMTTQYNLLIRWIVEIFSVQSLEDVGW
jgi:hypothetical protein